MASDNSKPAAGKQFGGGTDGPTPPASSRKGLFSDAYAVAFTRWVIRWRWTVILLCLIVAVAAAAGGRFLGFASDYRIFFSSGNPQLGMV